jgi:hypothetical protein
MSKQEQLDAARAEATQKLAAVKTALVPLLRAYENEIDFRRTGSEFSESEESRYESAKMTVSSVPASWDEFAQAVNFISDVVRDDHDAMPGNSLKGILKKIKHAHRQYQAAQQNMHKAMKTAAGEAKARYEAELETGLGDLFSVLSQAKKADKGGIATKQEWKENTKKTVQPSFKKINPEDVIDAIEFLVNTNSRSEGKLVHEVNMMPVKNLLKTVIVLNPDVWKNKQDECPAAASLVVDKAAQQAACLKTVKTYITDDAIWNRKIGKTPKGIQEMREILADESIENPFERLQQVAAAREGVRHNFLWKIKVCRNPLSSTAGQLYRAMIEPGARLKGLADKLEKAMKISKAEQERIYSGDPDKSARYTGGST